MNSSLQQLSPVHEIVEDRAASAVASPQWTSSLDAGFARMHLQLPLRQWGAGNVYLLVLSSWKVNIAKTLIAIMGL